MKKIICFICILVLGSMGSMEAYASYNTGIYEQNDGIYGESETDLNEGNELGKEDGSGKDEGNEPGSGDESGKDEGNEPGKEDGSGKDEENKPGEVTSPDDGKEEAKHVLLVGNSFTRETRDGVTWTIEQPLEELAAGEGHNLEVTTLAHGSARLTYYAGISDKHVSYYGELMGLLVNHKWDYIIFQEQTTNAITSLESEMIPAVQQLRKMVTALQPQAKMFLYMNAGFSNGVAVKVDGVNRLLTTQEMSLRLAAGFKEVERQTGVEVIMVGMHSRRIDVLYPWINLTQSDNKHPNYAGYFLAASCFYYKIYGTTPNPWKATLTHSTVPTADLSLICALPTDYLMINKSSASLRVGNTTTVQAAASSRLWQSYDIAYKSLDSSVASVNAQTGLITAKKEGDTVVYAEAADGMLAFCSVSVKTPLAFSRQYYLAGKGDKISIKPQGNKENLKWHSGNKKVATVDTSGLVTVIGPGRATIVVTNKDNTSDKASYLLYVELDSPQKVTAKSMGKVSAKKKTGKIKVSWQAVSGAKKYYVYRSTKKNGTYTLIGTSKKRTYVDKTAAVNKNYYYKVEAGNSYKYCTSPLSKRSTAAKVKRLKRK